MSRKQFIILSAILISTIVGISFLWSPILWSMVIVLPSFFLGIYDMIQKKRTIMRNFPLFGRGRYIMEALRPKIYQYFVESDIDGRPINRIFRSVVYQRSKGELDTVPFGTQFDVYKPGYEWMSHSINPLTTAECECDLRVMVGGKECKQPYNASIMNISAMSFGALSDNAIMALNLGAKLDNFAHNTGEGGISQYHLINEGDLIYQIGTGYFGSRTIDGKFDQGMFIDRAAQSSVKMIEIKLSQGAKPGHGGILPAGKNTPEIAKIRGVEPGIDVISPPRHNAFSTPYEMMEFVQKLRELSKGKPVGFKLCIGNKNEFIELCKVMQETEILPDLITIDGGEGGTGAAPVEYSNSVGMPLRDGLAFAVDCLNKYELKNDIKVIASGKIITGFHLVKNLALGADMVNCARSMMFALGCIQALECNNNRCPTGIATQDHSLAKGLDVQDKAKRVARYHKETVKSVTELLAAAGLKNPSQLNRSHIYRRISAHAIKSYADIYPSN
ncbi:MAG: FMN-binding glutamate synthase family protein [Planctomycetia bacterium]|nr:FMN-binding glutamate synthase family protein [Planctomycetia bacterium]